MPNQYPETILLSSHFTLAEANCRSGAPVPPELINNAVQLATNLEFLRSAFLNLPIKINSWYRTKPHNANIGGSPNSQHLLAKAADITIKDIGPEQIHSMIQLLITMGLMQEGGLGLYDSFVHYDIRGVKARWDLRSKGARSVVTL